MMLEQRPNNVAFTYCACYVVKRFRYKEVLGKIYCDMPLKTLPFGKSSGFYANLRNVDYVFLNVVTKIKWLIYTSFATETIPIAVVV